MNKYDIVINGIMKLLQEYGCAVDVGIRYDGDLYKYSYSSGWVALPSEHKATDIDQYACGTIHMTFEGAFYHEMNNRPSSVVRDKFLKLLSDNGLEYERGYAWSLSII